MKTLRITLAVEVNEELHNLYVQDITARMRGSVKEDRRYYWQLIVKAGNYDYDPGVLAAVLASRIGFASLRSGTGTERNPVFVSDFEG